MTGTGHVWRRGYGWAYCSRCGVVRHFNLETQCRGALPTIGTRDGEQGLTADELVRFRGEVAELRRELAELKREGEAIHAELTRLGGHMVAEVRRAMKGGGQ